MSEEKKSALQLTGKVIMIAIIIVIIILTFGWLVKEKKEKILNDIDELDSRINQVRQRISELSKNKKKLERRKKIRLLIVRLIIGVLFIVIDYFFIKYTITDCKLDLVLNNILIINGAILMGYSFVAFIIYGTISNFLSALKRKFLYVLEKRRIDSIEELNALCQELEELLKKREAKEKELENVETDIDEQMFNDLGKEGLDKLVIDNAE